MKILLCAEGPNDFGRVGQEGWLQAVLKQALSPRRSISFQRIMRNELFAITKPRLKGHGSKAQAAHLLARRENCDAVVFMADSDTKSVRDWRKKYKLLVEGFDTNIRRPVAIACFPKSSSESWLLSDVEAWSVLGLADGQSLPRRPEDLWGARRDPASNHPKNVFSRVCELAGQGNTSETRYEVAIGTRLTVLESQCSVSFPPFHESVVVLRN